jgi:hypothetical protein
VEALQNEKTTIESENADIKEQLELSSDELNDLRIQYRSLGMYFHICIGGVSDPHWFQCGSGF